MRGSAGWTVPLERMQATACADLTGSLRRPWRTGRKPRKSAHTHAVSRSVVLRGDRECMLTQSQRVCTDRPSRRYCTFVARRLPRLRAVSAPVGAMEVTTHGDDGCAPATALWHSSAHVGTGV